MPWCNHCRRFFLQALRSGLYAYSKAQAELQGDQSANERPTDTTLSTSSLHLECYSTCVKNILNSQTTCWLCCRLASTIKRPFEKEAVNLDTTVKLTLRAVGSRIQLGLSDAAGNLADLYHPTEFYLYRSTWLDEVEGSDDFQEIEFNGYCDDNGNMQFSSMCPSYLRHVYQPLNQDRILLIKQWITSCCTDDTCCQIPNYVKAVSTTGRLPKRLLHMDHETAEFRLVTTESLSTCNEVKYATLSHCWGPEPFTTLGSHNMEDLCKKFPVSGLEKTFQEAIILCQALEVNYLWIDSLCIIQDSSEDWLTEAPKMHHIYSNSFVNIAATASRACAEGLFRGKSQLYSRMRVLLPDGLVLADDPPPLTWKSSMMDTAFKSSPLVQRGWVLQECYLAPRTLHWTDSQLFLHCKAKIRAEIAPFQYQVDRPNSHSDGKHAWLASTVGQLDRMWNRLADEFSRTDVTVHEDRYYAMSGLAAMFQGQYNRLGIDTKYLAGGWKHDLLYLLQWKQRRPSESRAVCSYAPTWSWLPSRDRIWCQSFVGSLKSQIRLVEAFITYANPTNPFGPLLSGRLRLESMLFRMHGAVPFPKLQFSSNHSVPYIQASLYPVTFRDHRDRQSELQFKDPESKTSIFPESEFKDLGLQKLSYEDYTFETVSIFSWALFVNFDDQTATSEPQTELHCAVLRCCEGTDFEVDAILMKPVNRNPDEMITFERVGIMELIVNQRHPSYTSIVRFFNSKCALKSTFDLV